MRGLRLKSETTKNKYSAIRTTVDGIKFDSKREAVRYGELKILARAGEIYDLEVHPRFAIKINGVLICHVELDFSYTDKSFGRERRYEDVKGRDNRLSQLKRKLIEATHGIKVEIVK